MRQSDPKLYIFLTRVLMQKIPEDMVVKQVVSDTELILSNEFKDVYSNLNAQFKVSHVRKEYKMPRFYPSLIKLNSMMRFGTA